MSFKQPTSSEYEALYDDIDMQHELQLDHVKIPDTTDEVECISYINNLDDNNNTNNKKQLLSTLQDKYQLFQLKTFGNCQYNEALQKSLEKIIDTQNKTFIIDKLLKFPEHLLTNKHVGNKKIQ